MGFFGKIFDKILDSMDNDPTLKWNVLLKNDGVMDLKGNWETKEIYLYGKRLEKEKAAQALKVSPEKLQFSWGSTGRDDHFLAFTLLYHFMSEKDAMDYMVIFCKDFIDKLPKDDFETELSVLFWWNNSVNHNRKRNLSDKYGDAGDMDDD